MSKVKQRILIIEDEPDLVRGLTDALGFEGYEVASASSGDEGIRAARTQTPDCIILDLMLPDRNGFAVCGEQSHPKMALPASLWPMDK